MHGITQRSRQAKEAERLRQAIEEPERVDLKEKTVERQARKAQKNANRCAGAAEASAPCVAQPQPAAAHPVVQPVLQSALDDEVARSNLDASHQNRSGYGQAKDNWVRREVCRHLGEGGKR